MYLIKLLSYYSYICFTQVPQNLLIVFALLSKNELVSFKLQIGKSTSVHGSVVESSLNCYEISFILWLLKNSKFKKVSLVLEFMVSFS